MSRRCKLSCAFIALGRLALVTGIRRLFFPHVGMRGSVKHLFQEFQNSLWDRREKYQDDVPEEFLTGKPELQREALCALLSEKSCAEWLGFNDLARPDTKPPMRRLAGLVREPGLTDADNIHKLRMYRAAAFMDCLRPNVLDWETPRIPDMEWVMDFIEAFNRPRISVEDQTVLIDDLSRPRVPLDTITRTTRGPRLELSASELRYVWETKDLSHEARAIAWDSRVPRPFQPLDRSNVEMYRDKKLRDAWRVAVNRQLHKAKAMFDLNADPDEHELK